MLFSSLANSYEANAAIAELILAPVALLPPDAGNFSTVGLTQVAASGTSGASYSHTVTAHARGAGETLLPGATVIFTVLAGPNAGQTGTGTTGPAGMATFTYNDLGGAGTDTVQAFIGSLASNTLQFVWGGTPVVTVGGNLDILATSSAGAPVTFTANATDDVDNPPPGVTCTTSGNVVVSGATFPIGATLVTCTAINSSGATGTATFTVTVRNNAPTFVPPAGLIAEAAGPLGAAVSFAAVGEDVEDGAILAVCTPSTPHPFPLGTTTVECVVTDSFGLTARGSFVVTVVDTTPPALTVPAPISVHATSSSGAVIEFSSTATDIVDGLVPVTCTPAGSSFPIGETTVTCAAVDRAGNTVTASFTVNVTNAAPVCTAAAPSIAEIWPVNHKLIDVGVLGVTDADGDRVTLIITSIFQDERTNSTGDGNTAVDGYGVGTTMARVRAERDGDPKTPGNGRIYFIRFAADDGRGGGCVGEVRVGVPHDQSRGPAISDGPLHDSTIVTPGTAVKK